MLGWFRRLWPRGHSPDCFYYHDGARERRADPLVVGRKLETECPEYADLFALLGDGAVLPPGPLAADMKRQKTDAMTKLIAASRSVFDLDDLTDTAGVTDAAAFRVLGDWLVWMEEAGAVAKVAVFSTSQPRASPLMPADSITAPSAESGTGDEKSSGPEKIEKPEVSPESLPPSAPSEEPPCPPAS